MLNHLIFLNLALVFGADVNPGFVHDLLSASEHETHLNEDLARLLGIEYERQGSCDSSITSTCCTSCAYDGTCNNGGYCCESSKVRTKMLKSGESECPNSWESDCKLTKMIPVEGCDSATKHNHRVSHELDASSDSSSSEDRSGFRVMCLCLQTRRCCSGFIPSTYATTPYVAETTEWPWWWYGTTSMMGK